MAAQAQSPSKEKDGTGSRAKSSIHVVGEPATPAIETVNADLRPFFLTLGLAILSVIGLNTKVDASGLADQEASAAIVAAQHAGDLLISDELHYQRTWLKTRLLGYATTDACPDILILGSSTSGGMSTDMFPPGRTILNGWLGGPTIEDFEAFTSILRRAACVPRAILLGVDPWWSANGLVDDQRWQSVRSEYLDYQKDRGTFTHAFFWSRLEWNRLAERLNFTTTKESATLLFSHKSTRPPARTVHLSESDACAQVDELGFRHMRSFDGHYTQCPKYRPSSAAVQHYATHWLSGNMHRMAEWTDLDTSRLARLEKVIDAWVSLGARVVLSGNPYHPETFTRLHNDPGVGVLLQRLDTHFDGLMKSRGSVFVNLRDPARHGCTAEQFEDADHGTPECIREVVAKIAQAAQF